MTVELVFIHGWGLDAHFWDALATQLSQFRQIRIDLGFFGANPSPVPQGKGKILICHSLGFVHGIRQRQDWDGWIAINSFPRFVASDTQPGCTTAAELREMRKRLQTNPDKTLQDFYRFIGAEPPTGAPNPERLRGGLDELRDADIEGVLAKLDIPGLALASRNDPLVPLAISEALGRRAKRGGLKVYDEAGHMLPQTAPDWCARAIADFLTACFDCT